MRMNVDSELKNTDGKWIDIGLSSYKVRSDDHPKYQEELGKILEENSDMEDGKEKDSKLMFEVAARAALVDWKNVDSGKKKNIKFDVELARKSLPHHRKIAAQIFNFSRIEENYREIVQGKAKK